MKKTYQKFLALTCIFVLGGEFYAQGCSDAGFCTLNGTKPNHSSEEKNQFKVGISYGGADNNISILGNYVEYSRQITENFGVDAKVTSISQSGNGISNFGLSDIFLNTHYKTSQNINFIAGAKIPLSDANKIKNNLVLPMDYQSSLGTFDLILGIGYDIKKLQLVVALQQPLTQNRNAFVAEGYPTNSAIRNFQTTNQFKRKGDVLFRASYPLKLSEKLTFTPSILPIYHLANDQYTDLLGATKEIKGSQGFTLNGNAYLDYNINQKNALQLNLGVPFVVRDSRPDGLTRTYIANLEYKIKF